MNDLYDIERNYGCVPEYFRSRFEDEAHEYELEMEQEERFKANRKKLHDNWQDVINPAWECYNKECPYYESIGRTDSEDDWEHGICHNHECDIWKSYDEERR